jgi:hypothetical protein
MDLNLSSCFGFVSPCQSGVSELASCATSLQHSCVIFAALFTDSHRWIYNILDGVAEVDRVLVKDSGEVMLRSCGGYCDDDDVDVDGDVDVDDDDDDDDGDGGGDDDDDGDGDGNGGGDDDGDGGDGDDDNDRV